MLGPLVRVLRYAGLALAGALLGVAGAFLHAVPLDVMGARLPLLLPVVLGVLAVVVVGGGVVTGGRLGAALPALGWLLCTLPFAFPRPEGDLVVGAGGTSVAYLLLGVVVAGLGVVAAPDVPSLVEWWARDGVGGDLRRPVPRTDAHGAEDADGAAGAPGAADAPPSTRR
ncbi:MAG: DUF6113 family protein [Actinomycetes bacterium]